MDDAFGHWFAGFFDGEGCLYVNRIQRPERDYFYCCAAIQLRADELPILMEIREQTGIGTVTRTVDRKNGSCPQRSWTVTSTAGCLALRGIFACHPLRAKKRHDLELWSASLDAQIRRDWDSAKRLKLAIQEGRRFSDEGSQQDLDLAWDDQLALL